MSALADRHGYSHVSRHTGSGHTWTNHNPDAAADRLADARIDHILVRLPTQQTRGAVISAGVHDENHRGACGSDHSALVTTLDLS